MTEFLHDEFFELNPALVLASSSQSRHVSSVLKVGRSRLGQFASEFVYDCTFVLHTVLRELRLYLTT